MAERRERAQDAFRDRVKERLIRLGWHQKGLASCLGVSGSQVSRKLNGETPPTLGDASRWADALGCDMSWLLGGEETGHAEPAPGLPVLSEELLSSIDPDLLPEIARTWRGRRI